MGYSSIQNEALGELRKATGLSKAALFKWIEGLHWYDREIFGVYLKVGTYRAIQAETGIPWESCYKTIRKNIDAVRKKANKSPVGAQTSSAEKSLIDAMRDQWGKARLLTLIDSYDAGTCKPEDFKELNDALESGRLELTFRLTRMK